MPLLRSLGKLSALLCPVNLPNRPKYSANIIMRKVVEPINEAVGQVAHKGRKVRVLGEERKVGVGEEVEGVQES